MAMYCPRTCELLVISHRTQSCIPTPARTTAGLNLDLGQVGERERREDYISNHCFSHSSSSGSLNQWDSPIMPHSCLSRSPYTTRSPSSQ